MNSDFFFGDNDLVCPNCDATTLGDEPVRFVLCGNCYNTGVILEQGVVVCMSCAQQHGWTGNQTNKHSHPDGFTCDECGHVNLGYAKEPTT